MNKSNLPPPNYTGVPNAFIERIMPFISSLSELKVTLALMRKIFGWHKDADKLSISQLIKLTGLAEQSVRNGIESGMERGTILREPNGQSFLYSLNVVPEGVQDLDPSAEATPLKVRPLEVQDLGGQRVQSLDPQKKEEKETIKENKKEVGSRVPRSPDTKKMNDDEFISYCKAEPAYAHINIDWEAGKMRQWCAARGKQPTRRRFVNWLNNVELPMGANGNGSNGRHVQETSKANNGGTRAQSERDRRLDALRAQDERVTFTATPSVLD